MWRELISGLIPEATFGTTVDDEGLRSAELALGQPVPPALAALLRETGGVKGEYETEVVWDLDRIVADNLMFRASAGFAELYMPFDPLLFFGDAGNGDQFALLSPPVDRDDVFAWDHETDSRTWIASDLEMYLRRL